jgi:hypothetical protein
MMGKNVSIVAASLFFLAFSGSAASDPILNGTHVYLSTGVPYGLYQGYTLTLKSVSSEGSIWLELKANDTIVKSDIVHLKEFFTYNKTNRTILSAKLDNIYSGSKDQNLVSLFPIYQYADPDLPSPEIYEITPSESPDRQNNSTSPQKETLQEPVILAVLIVLIIVLSYIVRKLW